MSIYSTSPNQSKSLFATTPTRVRDWRRLPGLPVLFVALCLALATTARAQNIQFDDKAPGSWFTQRNPRRADHTWRQLFDSSRKLSRSRRFERPGRPVLHVEGWNVEVQGYNAEPPPPFNQMQPFTIAVAQFAKHSVAGWTSSIGMPIVDDTPNQHPYNSIGQAKVNNVCPYPCYVLDRKTIWMPYYTQNRTCKTMSTSEDRWFEVWFSPGEDLRPTWLLIVTPDSGTPGHVLVYDPQENRRIIHRGDYENILQWLGEDEYSLVEGRMFPDDGLPLDLGSSL